MMDCARYVLGISKVDEGTTIKTPQYKIELFFSGEAVGNPRRVQYSGATE
jgi:hypothetical protein